MTHEAGPEPPAEPSGKEGPPSGHALGTPGKGMLLVFGICWVLLVLVVITAAILRATK